MVRIQVPIGLGGPRGGLRAAGHTPAGRVGDTAHDVGDPFAYLWRETRQNLSSLSEAVGANLVVEPAPSRRDVEQYGARIAGMGRSANVVFPLEGGHDSTCGALVEA